MDLAHLLFGLLALFVLVGYFHVWHLVTVLRNNSRVISLQLDQLLKASGVKDPIADRKELSRQREIDESKRR